MIKDFILEKLFRQLNSTKLYPSAPLEPISNVGSKLEKKNIKTISIVQTIN